MSAVIAKDPGDFAGFDEQAEIDLICSLSLYSRCVWASAPFNISMNDVLGLLGSLGGATIVGGAAVVSCIVGVPVVAAIALYSASTSLQERVMPLVDTPVVKRYLLVGVGLAYIAVVVVACTPVVIVMGITSAPALVRAALIKGYEVSVLVAQAAVLVTLAAPAAILVGGVYGVLVSSAAAYYGCAVASDRWATPVSSTVSTIVQAIQAAAATAVQAVGHIAGKVLNALQMWL